VALRGKVGCLMHRGVASVVVQMNVTCWVPVLLLSIFMIT
jgi:hypothetical protein